MKEIREYSEEKTSSGMNTVFLQATFFKGSNLALCLLKGTIQLSLRVVVNLPLTRITTLPSSHGSLPIHGSLPMGAVIAQALTTPCRSKVPGGAQGLYPSWSGSDLIFSFGHRNTGEGAGVGPEEDNETGEGSREKNLRSSN